MHNKSFNRHVCKPQPLRSLAEYTVLVSHRLLRDELSARETLQKSQPTVLG
jgi:hypothetical protein